MIADEMVTAVTITVAKEGTETHLCMQWKEQEFIVRSMRNIVKMEVCPQAMQVEAWTCCRE